MLGEFPHASDHPWWDDFILRVLPPVESVNLNRNEIDVIRAHVRHEVLHSVEIRKVLEEKVRTVVKGLREAKSSAS